MASLFKRNRSPFWWIKYRDPQRPLLDEQTGKEIPRRQSTGFRHDNKTHTKQAKVLESQKTLLERQFSGQPGEQWSFWVDAFIDQQYERKPKSKLRFKGAWRMLKMFLEESEITMPRLLTYDLCMSYFPWRAKADVEAGKYRAGYNTALLEMKFLGILMKHAVRRGFTQGNPCRELGLEREPSRVFPEYSNEDLQIIVDGFAKETAEKLEFLRPSFLVAHYHGVRLTETNVNPSCDVRIWKASRQTLGEITFHQKGGKVRTKPLHPQLVPLFVRLRAMGNVKTFQQPTSFAKEWHNYLLRCGIKKTKPNACFHSLRVTVENRLRRAKVPKEIRKAYLSHDGKEDVNALYDRIEIDEMRVCHEPLNRTWHEIKPAQSPGKEPQTPDAAA